MRSSVRNAVLGSVALGLTLVLGASGSAYAQQQPIPMQDTSSASGASSSADTGTGAGASTDPSLTPATPTQLHADTPYTMPSMGGSAPSSNIRGPH